MRKLLLAVSLVSAFVLIAEAASARPRGARSAKPAAQPAAAIKRPGIHAATAQKAQETAAPPRHWRVAVPAIVPRAQKRDDKDAQGSPLAAMAGADDVAAAASAPQPAAPQAAAPQTAAAKPAPQAQAKAQSAATAPASERPIRAAMAKPDAQRKASSDGPKLPYKFAVCYWNQTGQCVAQ